METEFVASKEEVPTRDHNRYNFDKSYIAHHYFIVSLSDLCTGVKNRFLKNTKRPMGYITHLRNSSNQKAYLRKAMIKFIQTEKHPLYPF